MLGKGVYKGREGVFTLFRLEAGSKLRTQEKNAQVGYSVCSTKSSSSFQSNSHTRFLKICIMRLQMYQTNAGRE